jgi:hypothetical protein
MIHFEDTRSEAQKSADLEVSQMRVELEELRKELAGEKVARAGIFRTQVEYLEERLARLYCEFYELQAETT